MVTVVLMFLGFIFLIKGADVFVEGASLLAKKLKVSDLVIGLTVVGFGTSAPELFVNVVSAIQGQSEITLGNIFGSNIYNILLILGLSALIYPLAFQKNTIFKEIPLALLAVLMCVFLLRNIFFNPSSEAVLTRWGGFLLLGFFGVFLYYIARVIKKEAHSHQAPSQDIVLGKVVAMVIFGLLAMIIGAKAVVDGAVYVAEYFKVSQSLIGLTIVAIGTSLPELATSVVAAYRKNSDIAIGNIVGSNIFNIFFVLGISALIRPIPVQGYLYIDLWVLVGATALLFLFALSNKKRQISVGHGIAFLLFCLAYTVFIIQRG